jgi:hypothetical protein
MIYYNCLNTFVFVIILYNINFFIQFKNYNEKYQIIS